LRLETLPAITPASRAHDPLPSVEPALVSKVADLITTSAVGSATPLAGLLETPPELPNPIAEARQRLEAIVLPTSTETSPYGTVERVSFRPNEYRFYWEENKVPLEKAIRENKTLVATARQSLEPEQRAGFDRLWTVAAKDIGAQAALQLLVMEGTLTTMSSGEPPATLLQELTQLADQGFALAPGLDRTALLCDLMQEIAFPSSISQRNKGTCSVTTAQILLTQTRPAEYARIVRSLAAEAGEPVTLAGGGQWQREPDTETNDKSHRTESSRLFQAAAMEGTWPHADYDNTLDKHSFETSPASTGGGGNGLADVVQDLLGPGAFVSTRWQNASGGQAALADEIIEAAKQGFPSSVSLYRKGSAEAETGAAHQILAIEATDTGIRFINPWGQIETVSREALAEMVFCAIFVNPDGTEPPLASLTAPKQP
jgi:hypothetical protein